MKTILRTTLVFVFLVVAIPFIKADEPLRIIFFGAHPDDCDINGGGVAALYAEMGHKVKFISLTNGNKGHHLMEADALAARRKEEMKESGRILGIEYSNVENNDGELMPTLANRMEVIRLICEWEADLVITHRPNDYHPDHRYTSQIVQDAAYMISVPKMIPDGKPLMKPVVFLYMIDRFQKPNPFTPDIVVDITPAFQKKADAICAHESQVFEWLPWNNGYDKYMPEDKEGKRKFITERYLGRNVSEAIQKAALNWYTADQLPGKRYFEAFEICEYGSMPTKERIKELFPMLPR